MQLAKDIAAVITGGASGLGAATAKALAAKGVKVALLDLNVDAGETIIIEAPSGARVRLEPLAELEQDRVPGLLKDKIKVPARLFEPMTAEELKLWYGDDT